MAPRSAAVAGWWLVAGVTCVAAYQPKGAASLAASYINLANPGTYDAAPGVAPTWATATGWTFNGATQYLLTGITPVNDQTWSMIAQVSNVTQTLFRPIAGTVVLLPTRSFQLQAYRTSPGVLYGSGSYQIVAPNISAGNLCVAGTQGYRNGVANGAVINAVAGTLAAITIGMTNIEYYGGNILALAIYSGTLSAPQVAAVSAAMAAL